MDQHEPAGRQRADRACEEGCASLLAPVVQHRREQVRVVACGPCAEEGAPWRRCWPPTCWPTSTWGVKRLGHQTVLLSANHSNSNPAKPKGSDAGSHHAMADHPLKATPIGSKYRVITVQRTSIEPRRPATHKLKRSIASLASAPSFQL